MPFLICRHSRSPRGIFSHVSELRNNRTKTWSHPSVANPADCWTVPVLCIRFNRCHETNIRKSRASHVLLGPLETHDRRPTWTGSAPTAPRPEKQIAYHSFPRLRRYNTLYKTPIIHPETRKVFPYGLGTNGVGHHWLMLHMSMDSFSPPFEDPDWMDNIGRATLER